MLDTPGHSPGLISLWREFDRVLLCSDVLFNRDLKTQLNRLREPPKVFTLDPARARESAHKVAALEPAVVCFGHGPPLRNTRKFVDFVASLGV